MNTNRISGLFATTSPAQRTANAAVPAASGFVVCPAVFMVCMPWQLAIYQQAFERAQAEVESASKPYSRFVECWN